MSDEMKPLIAQVADGEPLSQDQATQAFNLIMQGQATPSQIAGFLMALRVRGETVDEITGAATAMRAVMTPVQAPPEAIDVVGTGGDGAHTFNISTASAFVTAACGAPVAKHGNKGVSSKSGAADVLGALGVNIDVALEKIATTIAGANMGFMMAPKHHAAMRHVMPARLEMGTRTIFNILGPLANPARTRFQLVGVFAQSWIEPLAKALGNLGVEQAWVVHGADGLDEITLTDVSFVAKLSDGAVTLDTIDPRELGYRLCKAEDLRGGSPDDNAKAMLEIFGGARTPYAQTVELNAGAALVIAGRAADHATGCAMAREALTSGAALRVLEKMRALTND